MKNLFFRIFFIAIFWAFTLYFSIPWSYYQINVPFSWEDYRLWIDLWWWIELDYKVDLEEAKKEEDYDSNKERSIIEWLKSIIEKRVETLNINDSEIKSANYWWEQHIIVQIPLKWNNSLENKENIKRAKETIWKVVKIEFKEQRLEVTESDLQEREEISKKALEDFKNNKYDFSVVALSYKDNYENITYSTFSWSKEDASNLFVIPENIEKWLYQEVLTGTWQERFWINEKWEIENLEWDPWFYIININDSSMIENWIYNIDYLFISKIPSEWKPATDSQWRILNDKYFIKSSVSFNELQKPRIELSFNNEWKKIFWELTKKLVWKPIAIFVWWSLLTAPTVNEPILNWSAVITWDYTTQEANKLSQDINIWVVPAAIYLTSEKTIDSKLWNDSLKKLINAWVAWFILIFIFLIYVYRLSGFIASVSLFIYSTIVLMIIKFSWVVLTLASIAWLVLSIGMAIDANILIFERIKDELRWWKKLVNAIEIWFKKSWSAIWDSNVTWLIVALILFIFGINLIKWFWLMLWLWIIVSLFSVMWISKILILAVGTKFKNEKVFIGNIKKDKN